MNERHLGKWRKSHFGTCSNSDILLNNLCKVFNKMLIDDIEKFIVTMLTDMQLAFMTRIESVEIK